ncbi:MAG: cell division protein SepF [Erysipelotrichaceae bacterium]|nr:cell division protein SepF [Erysipelotrichaceae bacterium]
MGYTEKIKNWFFEEGEDGTTDEGIIDTTDENKKTTSDFEQAKSTKTSNAMRQFSANKDSHLILFEPRAYSETQEIATYLKQKRAAVVNLHRLQKEQSKRVIDFLSGVIFAIEGDIQQIGPKIFLCTPKDIGVTGSITIDENEKDE